MHRSMIMRSMVHPVATVSDRLIHMPQHTRAAGTEETP
jgi:hypothetical protein